MRLKASLVPKHVGILDLTECDDSNDDNKITGNLLDVIYSPLFPLEAVSGKGCEVVICYLTLFGSVLCNVM